MLPDELLGRILLRAWADRPQWRAAAEVRRAADLASMCRRWRKLLRAQPLPLALDFSAARLSDAQRRWLLEPAQAGRVEAANFFLNVEEGAEDALWEQPVLERFLARHGGTLLHLSGMPLRLVASVSQAERPDLDLSGLRLTKLGVDCFHDYVVRRGRRSPWLWPEFLPGTLEELELLGLNDKQLGKLAWAPRPGSGLAGRLPRLHTLRVTRVRGKTLTINEIPLLDGFCSLLAFEVDGSGASIHVRVHDLFCRVGCVRVVAGGHTMFWDVLRNLEPATFVDRLCPAGMQAAELCAEDCIDMGLSDTRLYEVVRDMISKYGDRFAVEVGAFEQLHEDNGEYWDKGKLRRLAWRRWPGPGAPGLPAARAAHEDARAVAAEVEQWEDQWE